MHCLKGTRSGNAQLTPKITGNMHLEVVKDHLDSFQRVLETIWEMPRCIRDPWGNNAGQFWNITKYSNIGEPLIPTYLSVLPAVFIARGIV
jgi:hypothetical protein